MRIYRSLLAAGLILWLAAGVAERLGAAGPTNQVPRLDGETPALVHPRTGPVLTPGLQARAEHEPRRETLAWVFFTDKGVEGPDAYRRALETVSRGWNEKTRARRATLGDDFGLSFTDLPVHEPYVDRLRDAGYRVRRVSRWLNAASVSAPAGDLVRLKEAAYVRRVAPVQSKRAGERDVALPTEDPHLPRLVPQSLPAPPADSLETWFFGTSLAQLGQIQALDLHRAGYTGAGVRVMVLDTGYKKDHPAFACANLVAEYDFVNEDGNTQNEGGDHPSQHHHGTGVWGTLGGYAPGNLIGPAFAAEIVLAKTEDIVQEVRAEEDNYVAALEWADTLGVDVTTASLSYFTFDDSSGYTYADLDGDTGVITIAVDLAVAKGISCLNAMGNAGPGSGTLATPQDADSVIAVGAVDACDVLASFSSRGPTADGRIKPEVAARGVATTWAQAWTDGYGTANGTSLATPLVAGLAAILKEAQPGWSGADIRAALMATASQAGSPDNNLGYGIARGMDAMNFGGSPSPPRMTLPFALLLPPDGDTLSTGAPTLMWESSAAAPGDSALYSLILAPDSLFTLPDTIDTGSDTTWAPAGLATDTTYWWKVEARGVLGFARKSYNVHRFTTPAASGLPADPLAASSPFPGVYPNPARGPANLVHRLPDGVTAQMEVYAVDGRRVRQFRVAGTGSVSWDGRDEHGRPVTAGIYFVRLHGPAGAVTRRLVRLP